MRACFCSWSLVQWYTSDMRHLTGTHISAKWKAVGILMMGAAAKLPGRSGKNFFFPRSPTPSAPQHILQQDPNCFQAVISGKGELEPNLDPSSLSSLTLSWSSTGRNQADDEGWKNDRNCITCRIDRSKPQSFLFQCEPVVQGLRYNAEQECSYWVPTWRERALQLCDNWQDIVILRLFTSG